MCTVAQKTLFSLITEIDCQKTFMQLADSFIQNDLHCIQDKHFSLGIELITLALLISFSTVWATGIQKKINVFSF